jgi:predicted N-acetyltransferase YhbS
MLAKNAPNTAFLFIQGFYVSQSAGRKMPGLLHAAFIDHLRFFCERPVGQPPVLYSPVKQPQSFQNLASLGFEYSRMSQAGFKIMELDCRRLEELSEAAHQTYKLLCSKVVGPDSPNIRALKSRDYGAVHSLWLKAGITLRETDEYDFFVRYLDRNPNLSLVYELDNSVCGVLLCGHDGRAGYIHHMAVRVENRLQGIGGTLVQEALQRLNAMEVRRCHIFVLNQNEEAVEFWQKVGFQQRASQISVMTHEFKADPDGDGWNM